MKIFYKNSCSFLLYLTGLAYIFINIAFLLFTIPAFGNTDQITDEAQVIYKSKQKSVYQIQVIDLATGKKTAIGSGFQFTPDGYIATNYHVLSFAINSPDRFRVEYIRYDGSSGSLKIVDVDVVHDVAIVKSDDKFSEYIEIGKSNLLKGSRIFSMGNPLDIGMTIVEGIYNGLMENSLYQKILFSGSLNSGMSGGPALNHEGKVIGINVSTAGNQVSFLVPSEYLVSLYNSALENKTSSKDSWDKRIEKQLLTNQDKYMKTILSSRWDFISIGDTTVPGEISKVFKCWGSSKDEEKKLFKTAVVTCSSEDLIYLSSSLYTGQIIYKYNWIKSKGLNSIRFYNLYENYFVYTQSFGNAQKEDVTNFKCSTEFVKIDEVDWKAAMCARNYKKYPKLFDIYLSMASINESDKGLILEVKALGVDESTGIGFVKKFMEDIKWKK